MTTVISSDVARAPALEASLGPGADVEGPASCAGGAVPAVSAAAGTFFFRGRGLGLGVALGPGVLLEEGAT